MTSPELNVASYKDVKISNEEWLDISLSLENHHAIFHKIWQMGKPIFNDQIETAAVQFDHTGEFVWFHFNPSFWKRLELKDKLFVICHEALHVILNHGVRTRGSSRINADCVNAMLDVVVNHSLVNNFGFIRNNIQDWEDYCWIDTVFKNKPAGAVRDNESFEYYYNLADKIEISIGVPGNDGEGKGNKTVDDHSFMGEDADKIIDQLNSSLTEDEKKNLKDFVEKHFQEDKNDSSSKKAGSGTGNWTFVKTKEVKKKKWETIIKKWSLKYLSNSFKEVEQWARVNRRLSTFSDSNLFLPSEMEMDEKEQEENKVDVWFFLDTSGSCWHLKDRFFNAALSLYENKFNIRLFCFDTSVEETTLESKKVYGGGGTSFKILEDKIVKEINSGVPHPEAVFVITDGFGDVIKPSMPEKWHWFISEGGVKNYIDPKCNFYFLKDFE